MICPNCKNEIPDESSFCLKCGNKINSMACVDNTSIETGSSNVGSVTKDSTKIDDTNIETPKSTGVVVADTKGEKAKKKKSFIILAIISLCILALVGIGVLFCFKFEVLGRNSANELVLDTKSNESYLDLEGNAYFVIKDNVVKIQGDYKYAFVSKNGQNFVCLDADGTLYYFSSPEAEREKIDVDIDSIECVTDTAVFYATYTGEVPEIEEVLSRAIKERDRDGSKLDDDDYRELFNLLYDNTYDDAKEYYAYLTGKKFPEDDYIKVVYHKFTYETHNAIELVYAGKYVFSDNASIAATIDNSHSIVAYMPDSDAQQALCKVSENAELINFNDDLSNVIWYEIEEVKKSEIELKLDEEETQEKKEKDSDKDELVKVCGIYRITNGEKERLGDLGEVSSYALEHGCYVNAYFINNGSDFVIYGNSSPSLIIGGVDRTTYKIDFPDNVLSAFTDKGDALGAYYGHNFDMAGVERLLVEVSGEDYLSNIYQIDFNGEKTKLLSRVNTICGLYETSLLYIDANDTLQICDWSNGVINNEKRVTSETANAEITPDGKYILINKNMGNPNYDLYYVELNSDDYTPVKIHSNVMKYYFTGRKGELYIIADANEISNYKTGKAGDLYYITLGKETKKITKDVLALESIYEGNIIADKNPIVIKFSYVDSSHNNFRIYDIGIIKDSVYSKLFSDVVDKSDK